MRNWINKKVAAIFFLLFSFGILQTNVALAAWDHNPYVPGTTLNPECLPTDANCDVQPFSASAPITFSTSTGLFSISQASSTSNGYLSSGDWSLFNSAYSLSSAASSIYAKITGQIFTGDIFATNFTGTSTGNNTGDETTATIKNKLGAAAAGLDGFLTGADWNTFNSKQPAGAYLLSETDPIFVASQAHSISSGDITHLSNLSGTNTGDITSSVTGLTLTGQALSLTSGYNIPLTASTTAWNNKQDALGFTPENTTNKSTVTALGTSDTLFPTQNAVKTYVDTGLAGKQASGTYVTSVSAGTGLSSSNGTTPSISIASGYTLPTTSSTTAWNNLYNASSTYLTYTGATGAINLNTQNISNTGTINGATISGGSLSASAVNGITTANILLSSGSYSQPSWLTSILGSIVSGNISGNAANVTGTVAVGNGGTGTSTAPTLNQLLIGNGSGGYNYTSTTSLGLLTSSVAESGNLYYTDARARAALSSSATGLTYTSGTGVFSLTSGYIIPTSASTTNWNNFYNASSTYLTVETDPVFVASQAHNITATHITNLNNLSGTNSGDVTLGAANGLSLVGQALSLSVASTTNTGALSSTDWNTFNGKQNTITPGTTAQYLRGDFSLATFPTALSSFTNDSNFIKLTSLSGTSPVTYSSTTGAIGINYDSGTMAVTGGNLGVKSGVYQVSGTYVTSVSAGTGLSSSNGTTPSISIASGYYLPVTADQTNWNGKISLASLTTSLPLSYNNGTGAFSISQASSSANGYLSSTDWTTFNSKQPAGAYLLSETDPVFVASQAHNITATHITNLNNLSGTNTGDITSSVTGLTLTGQALSLTSGYNIPLTASTTNWNNLYNASSTYLTYTGATGGVNLNNQSLSNISTLSVGSATAPTGGVAYFNGNVGIGSSTPAALLGVNGSGYFAGNLTATGTLSVTGTTTLTSALIVPSINTSSNTWNISSTGLLTGSVTALVNPPQATYRSTITSQADYYWRLADASGPTVTDEKGVYNGTAGAGTTFNVTPGPIADNSASMSFNGATNGIITFPAGLKAYPNGKSSMSMEAWIKWTGAQTNTGEILGWWVGNDNWVGVNSAGSLVFKLTTSGSHIIGSTILSSTKNTGDGLWHHIVVTFSSGTINEYIDGSNYYSATPYPAETSLLAQSYDAFTVGAEGAPNDSFNGQIGHVAIYSTVLSPTTVSSHYTLGSTNLISESIGIAASGNLTASHWSVTNAGVFTGTGGVLSGNLTTTGNLGIGTSTPAYTFTASSTGLSTIGYFQPNVNNFGEVNIQNINAGNNASSDFVATANNGNATSNYINMGINSSTYNQAAYNIGGANSGYLYTSDGSLTIGTASTTNTNANLVFFTGGTTSTNERMRITAAGNVGIGTTTVAAKLTVQGSTGNNNPIFLVPTTSTNSSFSTFGVGVYGGSYTPITVFGGNYSDAKGVVTIYNRGGVSSFTGLVLKQDNGFGGFLMQAMDSNNVVNFQISQTGVPQFPNYGYQFGTTSYSTGITTLTTASGYNNGTALNVVGYPGQSTAVFQITSTSSATHGDLMSVALSGNVGIGSTTPNYKLSVAGTAAITGLTSATGGNAVCINATTGELQNSGGATCTVSSERFKSNIQNIDEGLDFVNKLRPVSFTLNSTGEPGIGFIAEEVNQLDSRLVFYDQGTTVPRGVRYENMTAVLAKAVQELSAKVDAMASSTASSTSIAGVSNMSLVAAVSSAFSNMTEWVGQKITATLAVFDTVQVNKGLEVKDSNGSGDVYCVTIKNGEWDKVKGTCTTAVVQTTVTPPVTTTETTATTTVTTTSTSTDVTATTTPVVVAPPVVEATTTVETVIVSPPVESVPEPIVPATVNEPAPVQTVTN